MTTGARPGPFDVLVLGSGVAGLSAAVRLAGPFHQDGCVAADQGGHPHRLPLPMPHVVEQMTESGCPGAFVVTQRSGSATGR